MKYLFSFILLYSFFAKAENVKPKTNEESGYQEEIQDRAKRRIYAGGQDESDLKVQVQIVNPTRKVAPTVEDTSEPASDD
jgi:hypothetical protein